MAHDEVAVLRVADEGFIVASTIERCPKTMMLRELMMNALEAASVSNDRKLVEISETHINSVPKLTIWNTGPGMDASQLLAMCDIASSIGKEKSLTGNFGMGAKVAALPSNQLGMRYRSCRDGRVHEVILCKRDGKYGRLRRYDSESGDYLDIVDVTELCQQEGRRVDEEWTEVVLHGNERAQDTVRDPYNGDPSQDAQWLATYLYHRFYRIPDGVKVTLLKGTNKLNGNRQFETIPQRHRHFTKFETVTSEGGIRVHYLYDAAYEAETGTGHNKSISGAVASAVSTCALIFKNEMYDVRKGRNWTFDAPMFGITFGAKHISAHVELPDDYPLRAEAYRQFLRYNEGEQAQVGCIDFSALVRENRPGWLVDIIRSFAPDSSANDDIRDELQKLLNSLRIRRASPRVTPKGALPVQVGTGTGADAVRAEGVKGESSTRHKPVDLSALPAGAKRAEIFKNMERAPEISLLRTESEIEEKGLKGRAAKYYMEGNQLFINMLYPAIDDMRAQLEDEYAEASDPEIMRSLALGESEKTMIMRVGRTVVFALAKQLNKEWDRKALDVAASPESLSMAADNYFDALQSARRAIGKALRISRSAPASAPTALGVN